MCHAFIVPMVTHFLSMILVLPVVKSKEKSPYMNFHHLRSYGNGIKNSIKLKKNHKLLLLPKIISMIAQEKNLDIINR